MEQGFVIDGLLALSRPSSKISTSFAMDTPSSLALEKLEVQRLNTDGPRWSFRGWLLGCDSRYSTSDWPPLSTLSGHLGLLASGISFRTSLHFERFKRQQLQMKWGSIVAITRTRIVYKSHGNNVHTGLLFTLYTCVPMEHTAHLRTDYHWPSKNCNCLWRSCEGSIQRISRNGVLILGPRSKLFSVFE